MKKIKEVILELDKQKLYKGKGGEVMRSAMSHFIKCCSLAQIDFSIE